MAGCLDLGRAGVEGASPPQDAPSTRGRMHLRDLEVVELRAFCAALDLGSISSAARMLHVSQPALSKRLSRLEAVAGGRLLERSTKGVVPTPLGTRVHAAARRLLAAADDVEAVMSDQQGRTAPVRVAASPTVAESWFPQVIVDLKGQYERHLSFELTIANSSSVRRMVREGASDLGLAAINPGPADDGLSETVIWESEVVVGVPAGHAWADVDEIDPLEFARTRLVRADPSDNSSRVVDTALERLGLAQATPLAEIGSTAAAVAVALAERAPILVAAPVASDAGMLVRRVRGVRFERRFGLLLALRLSELPTPARAFAEYLIELGRLALPDAFSRTSV